MSRCTERPVSVSAYKKTAPISLALLIVFGIVVGLYVANKPHKQPHTATATAPAVLQTDEKNPQAISIPIKVTAQNWNEKSTPVILHLKGTDGNAKGSDVYHAATYEEVASGKAAVLLVDGSYDISVISPINADGSLYDTALLTAKITLKRAQNPQDTKAYTTINLGELPKIEANNVTKEQLQHIVANVTTAVANGDDSLKGKAGEKILLDVQTNAAANSSSR